MPTAREVAEQIKKKKKSESGNTASITARQAAEKIKKYSSINTDNVNDEFLNSFFTDASNFLGNAKVEENSYNTWQDLSSRANTIKAWTWKNRDNLEKESYKSLNDSLSAFDSAAEYWNQFKTPEEYNKFWKEYSSYYNKWGKYADAEDYAQNSKYVSTRTDVDTKDARNTVIDPYTGISGVYYDTSKLFGDVMYDYINRNEDALSVSSVNDITDNSAIVGLDDSFLKEMTDNEIGIYNYLYATQSPEAAKEFLKDIEGDLTRRQRAKSEEYFKNYAKESPIGSSIFSILTSPLKGLSYVGQTADYLQDGKIDQNAGYNKFSYSNSAIRNEVSKDMSGVGNFLYNTGMSIGDFLYATAITGGFTAPAGSTAAKAASAASMAIMGTGAAADTVIASKDMGLSDNQAWILGTAAGAIEAATEKIGIDAMLDKKLLGESIGKYILKNVLAEGMEEGLSNIGNTVVELIDLAFSGDESKIKREIAMIMQEQGISESEAVGKYISGWFKEFGLDVLGGALSGGAVGGGGVAIHTAFNKATTVAEKNKQATQLYGDSTADLVSKALELDPNNKYAQKMKTILDSGKKLSGGQINRLLDETNAIIRNSAKSEETSDDSQANTTDTDSVESPSPTPQNTAQQAETTTTTENTTAEENATESEFKASEDVLENETVDNAATLEEASKKYGAQAQAMIHTYNKGQDVYKYDSAYKTAYDMGKSGVSLSYAKNSKSTAYLTDSQKELAYEAGKSAADTTAQEQDAKNKSLANGKIGRKKGTVKGKDVTISDLRKSFNDTQNKAYKILSTYAEVTGIDIVLYKSETDEDGNFIGSQGKFKWKEDTIYIDINAGLTNIKDVNDLAKYTMLRTFSHEFTHFIEKWNPIWYNEFRKVVFDTLTERGENVHELILIKMEQMGLDAESESENKERTYYNRASREVVAEAMTDILPDANFVEDLAINHKNIFDKLLEKLKEFLTDLKEYFKAIGDYSSREAKALKNEIDGAVHYVDNIVKLFDKVALEAVENYQKTVAIEEKAEKIDSTVTNNSGNISKSAEKVQNSEKSLFEKYNDIKQKYPNNIVLYRVGDFFEVLGEDAAFVAKWTGATMTSRNNPNAGRVPMVGFPFHTLEKYIAKITRHQSVTLVQEENGVIKEYPKTTLESPNKKETVSKAEQVTRVQDSVKSVQDVETTEAKESTTITAEKTTDDNITPQVNEESKAEQSAEEREKAYKKKFSQWLKKSGGQYVLHYGGDTFLSDGSLGLRATKDEIGWARLEFLGMITETAIPQQTAAFLDNATTLLTEAPLESGVGNDSVYVFNVDGKQTVYKKNLLSKLDGNLLYIGDFVNGFKILKAVDTEGNVAGFLLPMRTNREITDTKPSKLKSFSNKAKNAAKSKSVNQNVEIENANNERPILEPDTDTVQEQSRNYLDEDNTNSYSKSRKVPQLDEFSTYAMQWAYSDKTNIGEQKLFYRKGKWVLLEKSADGFVEMGAYAAENYDFIQKEIIKHNEKLHDSGINERVYRSALRYESLGSDNSRNIRNDVGQQTGNGRIGGLYQAESVSNRSTDNEEGKSNNEDQLSRSDSYEQNQQRTNTLTDREVLEIAAEDLMNEKIKVNGEMVDALSQAEKDALTIFQNRLSKLKDLQAERAEQGRLYKEQQFGEKGDKEKATETLNRMHILDDQIKKATADVLTVEEKEVLKRVLKKARKVVEVQERQHGQEILKRWRDRRDNAAAIKKYRERLRGDVDELSNWILNPNNKDIVKHVPDVLKNTVVPFLSSINFMSKRALKGGAATKADEAFMNTLKKLNAAIKTNIDAHGLYSGYNDLPPNFMERLQTFIDSTEALVKKNSGNLVINQMTSAELKELSQVVRTIKKYIMQVNRFHYNAMYEHVYEAGENSIEYLQELGNAGNTSAVSAFLLWQQIRPAYAFERFGDGGIAIYDGLRRGQAKLAFNTKEIQEFSEKTYTEKEVKAWENEIKTFSFGGDIVKMPVSYIMAFYELSKDPEALEHIKGEGIRIATYTHNGKKISDTGHILTIGDFNKLIGSLTDRQKEVADSLQKYMATQGGKWGNYVSVARFGEELFTNPHYFPINSDGRHLQANADEHPSAAALYALLNMSFTKSRKEGANNRIVIYSIFDVFANHMASMAQYNAMALPILDALKWFNYQQVFIDADGTKHIGDSVRERMDRAYGVPEETRPGKGKSGYAQDFVMNIIKAFNGTEAQGTPYDSLGLKSLHRYNVSQVAYNLRVVVQQPLAITRAGMLIDYTSILKGLRLKPSAIKKNIEEMQKYSGIAAWKSLGFYDVNVSRGLTHIIKHDSNALDKISDVGMWGAEKADLMAWAAIWSAAKAEVTKKQHLTPESDGFYEAVTKLFEDVIYKTQVVDSILTKNEFMRDKGTFARLVGSFMSEPTTNASMLIDAYDKYALDIQRGMTKQQAWQKNGKMIGRRLYVYAVGGLLLAAVQAAADALRDDDDYEEWYEKWLEAFGGNFVDELMPFNKLPILSDFYDLAKELLSIFGVDTYGNPPQSVFMQWYDSLIKGVEIINDKITSADTNYTWYGGIYKLLQALSGITGLPMASATRELITAWNNTIGAMAPSLKVKTYEPSDMSQIRYAYEDGYLTADEAVKEMFSLTSKGYSEENIRSQAKSQIGEWYSNDEISKQQTVNMLDRYFDMESDEIDANISYWDFKNDNPDIDVNIGWFEKYYSDIADSGISIDEYVDYRNKVKDITGEDKKSKRMKIINSLPISKSQKDALYLAEGWSESKLYEAPWH